MVSSSAYQTLWQRLLSLYNLCALSVISALYLFPPHVQADEVIASDKCLLQMLQDAPDTMTIGEAKSYCSTNSMVIETDQHSPNEETGVVSERLLSDDQNILKPFSLMAHGSNYLLAAAYNSQEWTAERYEDDSSNDISFNKAEIQFQLSIKTPLAIDVFDRNLDIFAAYTVKSFWQAYNSDISSSFRETNHQPEIWLQTENDWEVFGIRNTVNTLGLVHQSNGQSGELSRSWNRVFAGFLFEKDNLAMFIKPWIRINEAKSNDDNHDITDFLGHGEMHLVYKKGNHVFTMMSRNNLESEFTKGAVELGWSFPLLHYDYFKGYIQYFSGYGESLIDYNNYVNKIGFGILLTDIL